MPPLRLAILECDTPIGRTREKYGGYGNLFKELLQSGQERLKTDEGKNVELEITKFDVVNQPEEYPDVKEIDAVLLTGSKHDAFADEGWILRLVDFTKKVLEDREGKVRVVGVCFGHQIIGRALGVRVGRAVGGEWEVAVTEVKLTGRGREIFGGDKLAIHQMHRDIVYSYPEGVERLGSSERCEVQGMYVPRKLITVQGHPEFNGDIVTELLENRHQRGIFDDRMFEDGMSRVQKQHDGVRVAEAFLRFLVE